MVRSEWQCPACGQRVALHVQVSVAPTCVRHVGGGKQMKGIDDEGTIRTPRTGAES
jgi:hypothetical protein